jgi:endo-1,4-beta-xylanase
MFKHPELFVSTAPGGSGYEPEKRIQENDGAESATVKFAPGYNTWDLAKKFSEKPEPPLNILLWFGTKDFNYEFNLKFSEYLSELGLKHEKLVAPDAPHSAKANYEINGNALMQFHQKNFSKAKP